MKKQFKLKESIKNLIQGINIYKKEQRVLAISLMCFVICGAGLPFIKNSEAFGKLLQDAGIQGEEYYFVDEDVIYENEGLDPDIQSGDGEIDDADGDSKQDTSEQSNDADSSDSSSDSGSNAASSSGSSGSTGSTGNTGSYSGSQDSSSHESASSGTGNSNSGSSSGSSNSSGTGSSTSSDSPSTPPSSSSESQGNDDKVWVPPVYETIHHEAVYETQRVYVCNYCSAEFSSAGEFQVHKNANGG